MRNVCCAKNGSIPILVADKTQQTGRNSLCASLQNQSAQLSVALWLSRLGKIVIIYHDCMG